MALDQQREIATSSAPSLGEHLPRQVQANHLSVRAYNLPQQWYGPAAAAAGVEDDAAARRSEPTHSSLVPGGVLREAILEAGSPLGEKALDVRSTAGPWRHLSPSN